MNAPLLPVPTQQEWEEQSRNGSRRSVPLRKIDKAVSAFNKAPDTDHEARIKLADNLLADIEAWTRSKTKGNHIISKRLVKVRHLQAAAESERIRLQLLQSQAEFSSLTFNKVAVYSAGVLLHNDGRFADSSAQDYANAVQSIGPDEVAVRLAMLDKKLKEAYTHFSQQSRDETLGIFTIPEFFFKQPDTPFTEAQEKTIQSGLATLSQRYSDMLLVPGTTVWSREGENGLELRATASAFFNGHLVHQTHKHGMAYDESGYDRSTMTKAWNRVDDESKGSSFFTIGNRQFALEICGDHRRAIKELNEAPSDSPLKARSDIHILVSKGMSFSPGSVALKDGGIAISNDATIDERGAALREVWHSGQVIKDAATSKYGGSSLVKYKKSTLNKLAKLHFGTYALPATGS